MLAHKVSFYLRFSVFAGKVWLTASLKRETFKEKFPKLVSYLGYIWLFARFYLLLPMAMSIQIRVFFKSELYSCIFLRIMNCESWQSNVIEFSFWHGCYSVNLLQVFRVSFPKNTSEGLLLLQLYLRGSFHEKQKLSFDVSSFFVIERNVIMIITQSLS